MTTNSEEISNKYRDDNSLLRDGDINWISNPWFYSLVQCEAYNYGGEMFSFHSKSYGGLYS